MALLQALEVVIVPWPRASEAATSPVAVSDATEKQQHDDEEQQDGEHS
ncbi:MAG TPA: hypothetical protein VGZ52_00050 [Acidimicrobiales bacterium]|nr:hypothetical protein [Acidimicrobiales bacterium]